MKTRDNNEEPKCMQRLIRLLNESGSDYLSALCWSSLQIEITITMEADE